KAEDGTPAPADAPGSRPPAKVDPKPLPPTTDGPDKDARFVPGVPGWEVSERLLVSAADLQQVRSGTLAVSADGRHVAYALKDGDGDAAKYVMVLDGKPGAKYGFVERPLFSPDGKRLAFIAFADNEVFWVVDGKD